MALSDFWKQFEATTDSYGNKYISKDYKTLANENELWEYEYDTTIGYCKIEKGKLSPYQPVYNSEGNLKADCWVKLETDLIVYNYIPSGSRFSIGSEIGYYPLNSYGSFDFTRVNNLDDPYTTKSAITGDSGGYGMPGCILLDWKIRNGNARKIRIRAITSSSFVDSDTKTDIRLTNRHLVESPSYWEGSAYNYFHSNDETTGTAIKDLYPYITRIYAVSTGSFTNDYMQTGLISKATLQTMHYESKSGETEETFNTLPHCLHEPGVGAIELSIIEDFNLYYGRYNIPALMWDSSIPLQGGLFKDKIYKEYSTYTDPESEPAYFKFVVPNTILTEEYIINFYQMFGTHFTLKDSFNVNDDYSYIPVIENGEATGVTSGEDNLTNSLYTGGGAGAIEEAPDFSLDTNDYIESTDLETPENSPVGHFNRTFAISGNTVDALANKLYTADETVWEQIIEGLNLHGANPIEALIDLRMYPFNVPSYVGTASTSIVLGRTDLGISGLQISKNASCIIDLGNCVYPVLHGDNFLDSEPYTQGSLYIPYCGVTPIPSAVFRGKTISVKMIVDLVTGACTAAIYCNGIIWNYVNGQMGISIPMTSTDSATYAANMLNSLTGMAGATLQTAAAVDTGNMLGIGQGALGMVNAANNINSNLHNTQYQSSGSPSPCTSNNTPSYCYFCIEYSTVKTTAIPEYAHTVGYACNISGSVGSVSGYSVFANVEYYGMGTDSEKAEIVSLLTSGVYV